MKRLVCVWTALVALGMARLSAAQALDLVLPTSNDALFYGDEPGFYMYTDRNFDGIASRPWEGGQYGFHRNLVRTPAGIVGTRFHEGIDIRPRFRDVDGEPLDSVVSVDDGRVVYVNHNPRASAYGKYVVVEYLWQGSPYYGLYSHVSDLYTYAGAPVRRGQPLARVGYTGVGIDRRRAHLHFELNLYLSDRFEAWMARYSPRERNDHGRWNGVNLAGFDAAAFLRAYRNNPALWVPGFIRRLPWAFVLEVPGGQMLELVSRYPWLLEGAPDGTSQAYEITFTEGGVPIRVAPVERLVFTPGLVRVSDRIRTGHLSTNGYLARRSGEYVLTVRGRRYADLVATPLATFRPAYETPYGIGNDPR